MKKIGKLTESVETHIGKMMQGLLVTIIGERQSAGFDYYEIETEGDDELFLRKDTVQVLFEEEPENYAKPSKDYEQVNHPSHYNNYTIECIEMMRRVWGDALTAQWCEMTAFKYRMRLGTKPDNSIEQDLAKEKWYLNKAKELRAKLENNESN